MNRTCQPEDSFKSLFIRPFIIVSAFALLSVGHLVQPVNGQQENSKSETEAAAQSETGSQETEQEEVLRWQKLSPEKSGFEIQFPGEPKHVPRTVKPRPDLEVSVDMYTLSIRKGKVAFLAGFHDVQEMPTTDEKRKEILDGGIKGAMVNVVGELTSHEVVKVDGHPARTFSYRGMRRGRDVNGYSQLVLVGQRVYQITIIRLSSQDLDQVVIDKFFASFHLDEKLRIEAESETEADK